MKKRCKECNRPIVSDDDVDKFMSGMPTRAALFVIVVFLVLRGLISAIGDILTLARN